MVEVDRITSFFENRNVLITGGKLLFFLNCKVMINFKVQIKFINKKKEFCKN